MTSHKGAHYIFLILGTFFAFVGLIDIFFTGKISGLTILPFYLLFISLLFK